MSETYIQYVRLSAGRWGTGLGTRSFNPQLGTERQGLLRGGDIQIRLSRGQHDRKERQFKEDWEDILRQRQDKSFPERSICVNRVVEARHDRASLRGIGLDGGGAHL